MTDENKQQTPSEDGVDFNAMPKAKQHALLAEIDGQLRGAHAEETFNILGHKYTLHTLDPAEESWADTYIQADSIFSYAKNQRMPYLAAALTAIDGVETRDLFGKPEGLDDITTRLLNQEDIEAGWRRHQVLKWLVDKSKHGGFVQDLWNGYLKLDKKRGAALRALDPLSKSPSTGGSSDTSSREKESSSLIQPSAE